MILDCVKKSNLNFCLHLSPFSANISLKKTFVKDKAGVYLDPPLSTVPVSDSLFLQNRDLAKKVNDLETIVDDLNLRLKKSLSDCEQAYEAIENLENKLMIKTEKIETEQADLEDSFKHQLEKKTKEISNLYKEKKLHQDKETSLKTLIQEGDKEIQNLQRRLQISECAVTRLNKAVNTNKLNHEKETKLITKNLKNEIKSWKKDLGSERSEKIKAERKLASMEMIIDELKSKSFDSISCQTNQCSEIPYLVTTSLPPIFGSQLCKMTKPINFLSKSLPDISTLRWVMVTEEDRVMNAAEEALNQQYDRQVEEFYREKIKEAEAVCSVYEENGIGKLFEED